MRVKWVQSIGLGMVCNMMLLTHGVLYATDKPLNLQEVIAIALKENLDIQIAKNTKKAALFSNRRETANLWIPSVTFKLLEQSNRWVKDNQSSYLQSGPIFTLETKPLFLDKILTTKINRQKNVVLRLTKKQSVSKVLQEVVGCYYTLVVAQRKMELANIFIKTATAHLRLAEEQFSLGRARKIDVLDAKVTLQETKLELIEKQQWLKEARQKLNIELGKPQNEATVVQSTISLQPIWDSTTITKETMVDLDTVIKEHNVTIAATNLTKTKASLLSNISLSSSFQVETYRYNSKNRQWDNAESASQVLTIGLTLDIGKLLLLPVAVKEARIRLAKAKFELTKQKLVAENDLENKKTTYQHRLAAYKLEAEKLKLSKQKLTVEKERYLLNQITLLDLQEAEKKVHETEIKLIDKLVAVKKAEFEIYQLIGLLQS